METIQEIDMQAFASEIGLSQEELMRQSLISFIFSKSQDIKTEIFSLQKKYNVGAVGATLIEDPNSSRLNRIIYRTLQSKIVTGGTPQFSRFKRCKEVKSLPAGNFLCAKDTFLQAGGFSKDLWYCEDADFHARLREMGYKLFYIPGAEVIHLRHYRSIIDLSKHMFKYGVGRGYAIKYKSYLTYISICKLNILPHIKLRNKWPSQPSFQCNSKTFNQ